MTREPATAAWAWLADVIYRSEEAVVMKALGMIAAGCLWLLYIAHRISHH